MPDPLGGFAYAWPLLAGLLGGYLLGSIPFGLVLTKLAGLGDIRQMGSGNIGATNVLRTGNKLLAALTLILDGAKGAAAVLIAAQFGPDMAVLAGAGAFLGHLFPVWLKFRGGKGVATFLGVMLAIAWPVGIACCLTWLAVALVLRYSSLAALIAAAAAPILALAAHRPELAAAFAVMIIVIFWRHRSNIARLLKGEEPKLGGKKKETDAA